MDVNDFCFVAFQVIGWKEDLVFGFCFCGNGNVLKEENLVVWHCGLWGRVGGDFWAALNYAYVNMLRKQGCADNLKFDSADIKT